VRIYTGTCPGCSRIVAAYGPLGDEETPIQKVTERVECMEALDEMFEGNLIVARAWAPDGVMMQMCACPPKAKKVSP
jgi:hypothetical protein